MMKSPKRTNGSEAEKDSERKHMNSVGAELIQDQRLPAIFIIITTIAALILIRNLFTPGYFMNFDHPVHQGILKCFLDQPSLFITATWCGYMQAGIAPFQSYPILFYQLILFLSIIFPLALAYKLGLVLIWFLLPLIMVWIFFREGHPLAGAFAYAILLFQHGVPDVAGPEFFLIVGSAFNQTLGFTLFALVFYCTILFFKKMDSGKCAYLSILTALYFLAHPTTFSVFLPIIFTLGILNWKHLKSHFLLLAAYPILVLLLSSYFIVPVLFNSQSIELGNLGLGVISPWTALQEHFFSKINPLILVFGAIGLVITGLEFGTVWGIPVLAAGVVVSWILYLPLASTHLLDFVQFHRITFGIMYYLLLLGTGLFFERAVLLKKKVVTMTAFIVFLFLILTLYIEFSDRLQDLVSSGQPFVSQAVDLLRKFNGTKGRVLFEETYGQTSYPVNLSSVWGIAPVYTQSEIIGPTIRFFKNPYGGTKGIRIQEIDIQSIPQSQILDLLEGWNIVAIAAGNPSFKRVFSFLPVLGQAGPFTIYINNETSGHYFHINHGTITRSLYNKTEALVLVSAIKPAGVLFKVRYWGNWIATVNGIQVPIVRSDQDYMVVFVPEGKQFIRFHYVLKWWDYLGLIMTVLGLIIISIMLVFSARKYPQKNEVADQ